MLSITGVFIFLPLNMDGMHSIAKPETLNPKKQTRNPFLKFKLGLTPKRPRPTPKPLLVFRVKALLRTTFDMNNIDYVFKLRVFEMGVSENRGP